jgi:hypothetical protein
MAMCLPGSRRVLCNVKDELGLCFGSKRTYLQQVCKYWKCVSCCCFAGYGIEGHLPRKVNSMDSGRCRHAPVPEFDAYDISLANMSSSRYKCV